MKKIIIASVAVAALFGAETATAQTAGELTTINNDYAINRILDRFEKPPEPMTTTDPIIPALLDQSLPPPNADKLRFAFTKAEISGSTVFKPEELTGLFAPLVGKTLPLADLYRVTAEIGNKYVDAGYYKPFVFLPPQTIINGVVQVEIREFSVDAVVFSIDGRRTIDNPTLNAFARDIVASRPLTLALAASVTGRINQAGFGVLDLRPDLDGEGRMTVAVDLTTDPKVLAEALRGVRIPARLDTEHPPPDADKISFTLRDIEVTGSSVYTTKQLRDSAAEVMGQDITLARLFDITKAIADRYQADGYIETKVLVPAQTIIDGKVRVEIHEFIVRRVVVELDGEPVPADSMIQLMANRALETQPISAEAVSRAAQLIGDLPGIQVIEIVPPKPGEDTAILRVTRKTMQYSIGANNRGTATVGPYQALGTITENGLFGFDEKLAITSATTTQPQELLVISVLLDLPLTSDGLKLSTTYSNTTAKPRGNLSIYDATSLGTNVSTRLSYPFIRLPTINLKGYLQYDQMDSYGYAYPNLPQYQPYLVLGGGTKVRINNDRQRNVRLGGAFEILDGIGGFNRLSAQYSQGLKILGSRMSGISVPDSAFPYGVVPLPIASPTGNLRYNKGNIELQRTQSLPEGFAILGGLRGQYTDKAVPGAEKFNFGGADIGRGLQGPNLSGDTGFAFKSEFQYNMAVGLPYLQGTQLYIFYDWGRVWNNNAIDNRPMLDATTGIGARTAFTAWLSGEIEFGRSMIHGYYDKNNVLSKDPNLFVGLLANF